MDFVDYVNTTEDMWSKGLIHTLKAPGGSPEQDYEKKQVQAVDEGSSNKAAEGGSTTDTDRNTCTDDPILIHHRVYQHICTFSCTNILALFLYNILTRLMFYPRSWYVLHEQVVVSS